MKGRRSFLEYCQLTEPDFYKKDRWHLTQLCNTLQAFFENRIVRVVGSELWEIIDKVDDSREYCEELYIQMPPRHGKTRTLVNFCCWILGNYNTHKFMYTSYNDDTAADTSRFVRDNIKEEKTDPYDFIFHDFFQESIQEDNRAVAKWALEGQFFNFVSSGRGGSVTSKGCDTLIIDDPVKNEEDALSEIQGEKTWKWYTGTLTSRTEEGVKIIVNHTRWPKRDLIQRMKDNYATKKAKPYYELIMPVYNMNTQKMLCPELMSEKSMRKKMDIMDTSIFQANYQQKVEDLKGRMYWKIKTYNHIPAVPIEDELVLAFSDYAKNGDNYTTEIIGKLREVGEDKFFYMTDLLYTQDAVENYEDEYIDKLKLNRVDTLKIESNNGGEEFAVRMQERLLREGSDTVINWELSMSNKETRILTNSGLVQTMIIYPSNWEKLWPEFYKHVTTYSRTGKNVYDDAPDTLTMIVREIQYGGIILYG